MEYKVEIGIDQSEVGLDQSEVGPDQSEIGLDQSEIGVKQSEIGLDQSEIGVDQSEIGVDQSEISVDQCEIGMDEREIGMALNNLRTKFHIKPVTVCLKRLNISKHVIHCENLNNFSSLTCTKPSIPSPPDIKPCIVKLTKLELMPPSCLPSSNNFTNIKKKKLSPVKPCCVSLERLGRVVTLEPCKENFDMTNRNYDYPAPMHKVKSEPFIGAVPKRLGDENSGLNAEPVLCTLCATPRNDKNDIFIIGGLVDKVITKPVSMAKAKREGIRMAKFPMDLYLKFVRGNKSLTLDQTMRILLDFKNTGNWRHALRHIPLRKRIFFDEM